LRDKSVWDVNAVEWGFQGAELRALDGKLMNEC
jgi:hypothetical protein